jgi:hypothetical protein
MCFTSTSYPTSGVNIPTWGLIENDAVPGSAPALTVTDVSSISEF